MKILTVLVCLSAIACDTTPLAEKERRALRECEIERAALASRLETEDAKVCLDKTWDLDSVSVSYTQVKCPHPKQVLSFEKVSDDYYAVCRCPITAE